MHLFLSEEATGLAVTFNINLSKLIITFFNTLIPFLLPIATTENHESHKIFADIIGTFARTSMKMNFEALDNTNYDWLL